MYWYLASLLSCCRCYRCYCCWCRLYIYFFFGCYSHSLGFESMVVSRSIECVCWRCMCCRLTSIPILFRFFFILVRYLSLWALASMVCARSLWLSMVHDFFCASFFLVVFKWDANWVECLCLLKCFKVVKNHQQIESVNDDFMMMMIHKSRLNNAYGG